jgi:hypothetical protein
MGDRVTPGRPPIELSGAIMSLLSDEPFFGQGSRSMIFADAPDNRTSSGERSRNAKVRETMDAAWFERRQSKGMSSQSKFASGRASS